MKNPTEFMSILNKLGFVRLNKVSLEKYLGRGTAVALSHIKQSYSKLVIRENWSGRKIADITYLIASKKGKLYTIKFYEDLESEYEKMAEDLKLKLRSNYESGARAQIEKMKEKEKMNLLKYIQENGGL